MVNYIKDHEHEFTTLMQNDDWLHVYAHGIKDYGLDMNNLIHRTRHSEKYSEELMRGLSQEQILQQKFGDDSLTWNGLADYAKYIS